MRNDSVGSTRAAETTASPTQGTPALTLDANLNLSSGNVFRNGTLFLWSGNYNLGLGNKALSSLTSNSLLRNTAVGNYALYRTTTGFENTAVGHAALNANMQGGENTAVGHFALVNSLSDKNTAVGSRALNGNLGGAKNTALGAGALTYNETGSWNTATGQGALSKTNADFNSANGFEALRDNTTGHRNAALGALALSKNISGFQNTAVGVDALRDRTDSSNNTAIGFEAGRDLTGGSSNVFINSRGGGGFESNTLRIGRGTGFGVQELYQTIIHGIYNVTTAGTSHPVYVNSAGRLGKSPSSRRFKTEIHNQGSASSRLLDLRPVTFHFKPEATDGGSALQFGLIAEEVAEVFPELVDFDADGRPKSVKYHLLSSLLLNELQKQEHRIDSVERRGASARAVLLVLLLIGALAVTSVRGRSVGG